MEFSTTDIKLATWLTVMGYKVKSIIPISVKVSKYIIDRTPEPTLTGEWITGSAKGNVVDVINTYRHLLRDSLLMQRHYYGDKSGGNNG